MKLLTLGMLFIGLAPLLAYASLSGVDDIDPNIPAATQSLIDNAVMTYYQHPSVDKVNTVLDIMTTSDVLRKKTAWAPLIGFLTVVFADNKDHVYEWISRNDYTTYGQDVIVAALMHAKLKDSALIFAKGEQWKPEEMDNLRAAQDTVDLKHLDIILPGHIDTLWGAFFASGDQIYVNEIINALFMTTLPDSNTVPVPEGYDVVGENKMLATTTLKAYAAEHEIVRKVLVKRINQEKDEAKKTILKQLLPSS